MPMLILHAVIAVASLLTPRRIPVSIQRIITGIAVAHANSRWLAMVGSVQEELSNSTPIADDGFAEANRATQ